MSTPLWQIAAIFAYPIYLLLMAGVLRLIGAARDETVKWALKQAGRQRLTDLLRAYRSLPPETAENAANPPHEQTRTNGDAE